MLVGADPMRAGGALVCIALISALMLMGAYGFQYIGGLEPCQMCYWQRIPHWLAIGLLAVFWLLKKKELLWLMGAVMLVSAGLGLWHSGVESGWLAPPTGCAANLDWQGDTSAVLDALLASNPVPCNQIAWAFLGISMAGWNFIISFALAIFACISAYCHIGKKETR